MIYEQLQWCTQTMKEEGAQQFITILFLFFQYNNCVRLGENLKMFVQLQLLKFSCRKNALIINFDEIYFGRKLDIVGTFERLKLKILFKIIGKRKKIKYFLRKTSF